MTLSTGSRFSQVSVRSLGGGTPVPGPLPGLWSQVLSGGTRVPGSGVPQPPPPRWVWDTPPPPRDRTAERVLAVAQEDFFVFLYVYLMSLRAQCINSTI